MAWERKTKPTPLDAARVSGLYFLDGDVVGRQYRQEWIKDQKYPMLVFPSGVTREVWQHLGENRIRVFGAFDLPLASTRDEAHALAEASKTDVQVERRGERELSVTNPHSDRSYHITYDNDTQQMIDIVLHPQEAMELLNGESRAVLPPLYYNEDVGVEVIAPVKFFTPAGSWTWYASEGAAVDENGYFDTDKPKVDYLFLAWCQVLRSSLATFL